MFGLTDSVIVTVVNALADKDKKKTNFFSTNPSIWTAALDTIHKSSTGNPHKKSNIQKQAYPSESVKTIRQAFGITGTNFNTHTPFINGIQVGFDQIIDRNTEIVLIKNGLKPEQAFITAGQHRIIPMRTNKVSPTRLIESATPIIPLPSLVEEEEEAEPPGNVTGTDVS